MSVPVWSLDAALVAVLLFVAARVLATRRLFEAVALFVVFGLLMTLIWMRLGAPDIALAEAAIGTGFTGALFVAAVARLERQHRRKRDRDRDDAAR